MSNWTNVQHISDGEKVNQTTIRRVTVALEKRTNYLKEQVDFLFERLGRIEVSAQECDAAVNDYQIVYFNGSKFVKALVNATDPTLKTNNPLGIAYNTRVIAGKKVCDIVLEGYLRIPKAKIPNIVDTGDLTAGDKYYLSDNTPDIGRATKTAPASIKIPIFTSLAKNTAGDAFIIVNVQTNFGESHEHYKEEWDLTSATHVLAFTPSDPDLLLITVDGVIQRFDSIGAGTWTTDGDPDYTVSLNTVEFYEYTRYLINEDLTGTPKVVAWYISPIGNNPAVRGLIAGKNISFGSCAIDPDTGIATGTITINSKVDPIIAPLVDPDLTGVDIQSVEYFDADGTDTLTGEDYTAFDTIFRQGTKVSKLLAGQNISLSSSGIDAGTGYVVVNSNPFFNTVDLLRPDVIHLLAARETLLQDIMPVVVIEPGLTTNQAFVAKYQVPHDVNPAVALGVRIAFYPATAVGGTVKLKLKVYSVAIDDVVPGTSEDYIADITIPSSSTNIKKYFDFNFTDKFSGALKINNAVPVEPGASLVIHAYRDASDVYAESFLLDSIQLIYKKQLV